jgi:hypothetical protein
MGTTTFTGPIRAGDVLNTTGSTAGSVANVGYAVMAQSVAITQSATAAATTICIPANSQIIGISALVTVGFTGAAGTLNVGTSSTSTELVAAANFDLAAVGLASATPGTDATRTGRWIDVGANDVIIYVKAANAPVTTTGAAVLTVRYVQANNLTP